MLFGIAMNQTASTVAIIAQMITPAIFILACGNLLGSTTNRVARVFDRSRSLIEEARGHTAQSSEHEFIRQELEIYKKRAYALEYAMTFFYAAIGFFVAASLFVAISVAVPELVWLPTALTVIGALLVLAGSIASLIEVRLATGVVRALIDRSL